MDDGTLIFPNKTYSKTLYMKYCKGFLYYNINKSTKQLLTTTSNILHNNTHIAKNQAIKTQEYICSNRFLHNSQYICITF